MKKKFRQYNYDVWGNPKDGYDVNDIFRTSFVYELDPNLPNNELIKVLKKEGCIKKRVWAKSIEVGGDETWITFDYKGKPEFELRLED